MLWATIRKSSFTGPLVLLGVFFQQFANFGGFLSAQSLPIDQLHDRAAPRSRAEPLDERFQLLAENVRLGRGRGEKMDEGAPVAGHQPFAFEPLQKGMNGGELGLGSVG